MNTMMLIIGGIILIAIVGFVYFNSNSTNTAPTVPSGNVEASSTSTQATADSLANSATPTPDQTIPDLTG